MGCIISALSCCCCFTAAKCCCESLPSCKASTSARIMYSIFLVFGAVLSSLLLFPGFEETLQKVPSLCTSARIKLINFEVFSGLNCKLIVGYQAVYRVGFALSVFYAFLCILMLCASNSRDPRSKIQNGFWFFKWLLFFGILAGSFFISINDMNFRWMVVCMIGAFIFTLVQMIFLIDFGYAWNGAWLEEYQSNNSYMHYCSLLVFAILFYLAAMSSAVLLFIFYTTPDECPTNKFFIGFNLVLCILISIISILPKVQEVQPNSGILQASLISLFIMYLTWSAMTSGTDITCNPEYRSLLNITQATGKVSKGFVRSQFDMVSSTGIVIFFLFIFYIAFHGGTHTSIGKLTTAVNHDAKSNTESTLLNGPSSADDMEHQSGQKVWDDEKEQVAYSYSRLHFIFMLGSLYITMTLTNWYVPNSKYYLLPNNAGVWVKIASSWLCVLLYIWTLVAPIVLPNRDFS